jgi:hypothetical protein
MSDLISATAADFRSALEEFDAAWENPNHTRFTLPAVQVNSVLAEKYTTSSPIRLTRHMVWDMEQQKAWDPATFIPYVVSEGKSWGRHRLRDGSERFFRSSEQRRWAFCCFRETASKRRYEQSRRFPSRATYLPQTGAGSGKGRCQRGLGPALGPEPDVGRGACRPQHVLSYLVGPKPSC